MDVSRLADWWASLSRGELIWLVVGFAAQFMFTMRFVAQWITSERARQSVVPEIFWYFSFAGGAMLLLYAIHRMDPVFILGQAMGLAIYGRNIFFIWCHKRLLSDEICGAKTGPEKVSAEKASNVAAE